MKTVSVWLGVALLGLPMMNWRVTNVLPSAPLQAEDKPDDAALDDAKKIRGTWDVVTCEFGGTEILPMCLANARWIIGEDKLEIQMNGKMIQRRYQLNANADPKEIEMLIDRGGKFEVAFRGIYALDGDMLTVVYGSISLPPVKQFTSKDHAFHHMYVLRRAETPK